MPNDGNSRYVLLNHLVSRSATRARTGAAPIHGVWDLLQILEQRRQKGWTVEFPLQDDAAFPDEAARIKANLGQTAIRIRDAAFNETPGFRWATLLMEHVDRSRLGFPVVDQETFAGRELTGTPKERGAAAAHVVVRLPAAGAYDDGKCRCVIEAVPGPTRRLIEYLLCRQLRREADDNGWTFPVDVRKGKRVAAEDRRYTPRLEFHADVGRTLGDGSTERVLSSMKFSKRAERLSVAQPTEVAHTEFEAAVRYVVRAEQGPKEPQLLVQWWENIKKHYENQGYRSRLSFRHVGGGVENGFVHPSLDGATDLLVCQRHLIDYSAEPKIWLGKIDQDVVARLQNSCNLDELWPPSPHH